MAFTDYETEQLRTRNKAGVRAGRGTARLAQAPRYAAVQPNKPCQRAKKPVRRRGRARNCANAQSASRIICR